MTGPSPDYDQIDPGALQASPEFYASLKDTGIPAENIRHLTPIVLDEMLPSACPLGYTTEQVEQITAESYPEFKRWIRGQTGAVCDGRVYVHETGQYEPTQCADAPHGVVIYPHDVAQFIRGGQPLD